MKRKPGKRKRPVPGTPAPPPETADARSEQRRRQLASHYRARYRAGG